MVRPSKRFPAKISIAVTAVFSMALFAACSLAASPAPSAQKETAAPVAKNIIVMISDGCGYFHTEAASLYRYGVPDGMVYSAFPVRLAMSTYPAGSGYDGEAAWSDFDVVNEGATDSAAAGTAMATGHKTYKGAVGMIGSPDNPELVRNVSEAAESLGKKTGVVTSVHFVDATPSCFVTHNPIRSELSTIAQKMLLESAADVIMGGGHPYYDRDSVRREEPSFNFVGGRETWEALEAGTAGGDADGDGEADPWVLIQAREDFQRLASGAAPKRVCGVPQVEVCLQQKRGGDAKADPYVVPFNEKVPTLAEMTKAALNVLDDDPDGFLVMIEGGSVDHAGHSNQSGRMIEEQLDFVDAVQAVVSWIERMSSWDETLLIVTGDHETGYLTGPGSGPGADGAPPMWNPIEYRGAGILPGMEWHSGSHTNSLLPFYAKGAGAARFDACATGNDPKRGRYIDNTDVAKVIFAAMR